MAAKKIRKSSVPARRATISPRVAVPLNERRLNFGCKRDYAPAPEDSKRPFGGYKESGFGRERGSQGLATYCRVD